MFRIIKQAIRKKKLAEHGLVNQVDIQTVQYGSRSGMWTVAPYLVRSGDVVYSFGVGDNIAWDVQMMLQHDVEMHAFDPTPRSIEWINQQSLPQGFRFHPMGLADQDGHMQFTVPRKETKINYSAFKQDPNLPTVACEVKSLSSIMQSLGHTHLSILKMDIEGGEIAALHNILDNQIIAKQLLVEFHYHYPAIGFEPFVELMNRLHEAGYRIFDISDRGYEFSLVHLSAVEL